MQVDLKARTVLAMKKIHEEGAEKAPPPPTNQDRVDSVVYLSVKFSSPIILFLFVAKSRK